MSANAGLWDTRGTNGQGAVRRYVRSRTHAIFLIGAFVIAFHLITQAFIDPETMSSARGNVVTGVAGLTIVVGAALVYHRLSISLRAVLAICLGIYSLVTAVAIHIPHLVAVGISLSDVSSVLAGLAGIVLVGMGLGLIWRALPRLYYRLLLVPAVPIVLLQLVLPVAFATYVVNTPRQPLGDQSPADYGLTYEAVAFENDDGDTLTAWYVPSQNGAAIVLVHGAGKNRTKTLAHAAMLARHGYGTLMVDMRGYGESEGSPIALGWTGAEDVHAAVRYLETREDVEEGRIGALGLSMGGEIVLQATAEDEGIAAVVSEGAGTRAWSEYEDLPGPAIEFIAMFNVHTALQSIEVLSGEDQPPSNLDLIGEIAPRPVLLITTGQSEEGTWARLLQDAGGATVDRWETGGGHIDGLSEQPAEYESRVVSLFDEALLSD